MSLKDANPSALVAERIVLWLKRAFPRDTAKLVAIDRRVAPRTVKAWLAGALPENRHLISMFHDWPGFAASVLEPVIGPTDPISQAARLVAVKKHMGELQREIEDLGGPRIRLLDDAERGVHGGGSMVFGEGEVLAAPAGVTARRRPVSDIEKRPELAALRNGLEQFTASLGRIERAQAHQLAHRDPARRTGVAIRKRGSRRWDFDFVAPTNPLHGDPREMVGKAVTDTPDRSFGAWCARQFDEAAAAPDQLMLLDMTGIVRDAAGATRRTAVSVLRGVFSTAIGDNILIAAYVPRQGALR